MQLSWNVFPLDLVLQCIFISLANTAIAISCSSKIPFEYRIGVGHFFEHFIWWVSLQQLRCLRNWHRIWYVDFHLDMHKVLTERHLFYRHSMPFSGGIKRICIIPTVFWFLNILYLCFVTNIRCWKLYWWPTSLADGSLYFVLLRYSYDHAFGNHCAAQICGTLLLTEYHKKRGSIFIIFIWNSFTT